MEVVDAIGDGQTQGQIAKRLGVSRNTIVKRLAELRTGRIVHAAPTAPAHTVGPTAITDAIIDELRGSGLMATPNADMHLEDEMRAAVVADDEHECAAIAIAQTLDGMPPSEWAAVIVRALHCASRSRP
jgi:DNA-directed RNA polymerase specialized sigma24 family protein